MDTKKTIYQDPWYRLISASYQDRLPWIMEQIVPARNELVGDTTVGGTLTSNNKTQKARGTTL